MKVTVPVGLIVCKLWRPFYAIVNLKNRILPSQILKMTHMFIVENLKSIFLDIKKTSKLRRNHFSILFIFFMNFKTSRGHPIYTIFSPTFQTSCQIVWAFVNISPLARRLWRLRIHSLWYRSRGGNTWSWASSLKVSGWPAHLTLGSVMVAGVLV